MLTAFGTNGTSATATPSSWASISVSHWPCVTARPPPAPGLPSTFLPPYFLGTAENYLIQPGTGWGWRPGGTGSRERPRVLRGPVCVWVWVKQLLYHHASTPALQKQKPEELVGVWLSAESSSEHGRGPVAQASACTQLCDKGRGQGDSFCSEHRNRAPSTLALKEEGFRGSWGRRPGVDQRFQAGL